MKFDFEKNPAATPSNVNQEASIFNSIQMNKTIMNETLFQTFGDTDQLSLTTSQHIRVKDIFNGDTPKAHPKFPTIIPKQQRVRDKPSFLDEFQKPQFGKTTANWTSNDNLISNHVEQYCGTPEVQKNSFEGDNRTPNNYRHNNSAIQKLDQASGTGYLRKIIPNSSEFAQRDYKFKGGKFNQELLNNPKFNQTVTDSLTAKTTFSNYVNPHLQPVETKKLFSPLNRALKSGESPADQCYNLIESNIREFQKSRTFFNPTQSHGSTTPFAKQSKLLNYNQRHQFKSPQNRAIDRYSTSHQSSLMPKIYFDKKNQLKNSLPRGDKGGLQQRLKELKLRKEASVTQNASKTADMSRIDKLQTSFWNTGEAANSLDQHSADASQRDAFLHNHDHTPHSLQMSSHEEHKTTLASQMHAESIPMQILDQNFRINHDSSVFAQNPDPKQKEMSNMFSSLQSSKNHLGLPIAQEEHPNTRTIINKDAFQNLSLNSPKSPMGESFMTSYVTPNPHMLPKLKTRMTFYEPDIDQGGKAETLCQNKDSLPVDDQNLNTGSSECSDTQEEDIIDYSKEPHHQFQAASSPRYLSHQETSNIFQSSQAGINLRPEDHNDSVKMERIRNLDYSLSRVKFRATDQLLRQMQSSSVSKFGRSSKWIESSIGESQVALNNPQIDHEAVKKILQESKAAQQLNEGEQEKEGLGISKEMKKFVQQAILELDERRKKTYKEEKMKRRMFQDPALFQDSSSSEEEEAPKQKLKLQTNTIMMKMKDRLKDSTQNNIGQALKIGREQIKVKQIEIQIQALSNEIESQLQSFGKGLISPKKKKKRVVDSETDDEKIEEVEEDLPVKEAESPTKPEEVKKPLTVEVPKGDLAQEANSPSKISDKQEQSNIQQQSPQNKSEMRVKEASSPTRSPTRSPIKYIDPVKKRQEEEQHRTAMQTLVISQQIMNDLLKDAQTKNEKYQVVKNLQEELKQLMTQKAVIEKMLAIQRVKINKKQSSYKLFGQSLHLQTTDIGDKLLDIKLNKFIREQTSIVYKLKSKSMLAKQKIEARKQGFKRIRIPKLFWQTIVRNKVLRKKKFDLKFISKVINLQYKLEQILGEQEGNQNIGQKYKQLSTNLWKNHYIYEYQSILASEGIKYNIYPSLSQSQKPLDLTKMFQSHCQQQLFYDQAKKGKIKNPENTQVVANNDFFQHLDKNLEKPLPAFAQMNDQCLFLSQFRTSDAMAEALKDFLATQKHNPVYHVKKIFIDDCYMKDHQFAMILEGVVSQGEHLQTLVYSSNELGPRSMSQIEKLVPCLREIQINNISKQGYDKFSMESLLTCILEHGFQMQKLKLSNFLLGDMTTGQDQIIEILCEMIRTKQLITHYDLSWAGLLPFQLEMIATTLCEHNQFVKNLNLSYNPLQFDDTNEHSEQFVEKINEFISNSTILNHIDLSGMAFQKEHILSTSMAISQSLSLVGAHLNDLGLNTEKELALEILDMFNISENSYTQEPIECSLNRNIHDPNKLRQIVKNHAKVLTPNEIRNIENIEAEQYKKHILQVKQNKNITKEKIMHQTQAVSGIGRIETSLLDQFVLNRNINEPELIFNQDNFRDLYFDIEFGESWRLSLKNDCHVCQRHKCSYIFYQQPDPPGKKVSNLNKQADKNNDLIEVTDQKIIKEVKDELSLNYQEIYNLKEPEHEKRGEIAPIIVGTVVKGKWTRKLRMLRADVFSALSICRSSLVVTKMNQFLAIKRGIEALVKDSQNIGMKDIIEYFSGWERIMWDKCSQNTVTDVQTVNMPDWDPVKMTQQLLSNTIVLKHSKKKQPKPPEPDCRTFVYAAYLPPGLHQFLIYDPVSEKVFVKDVIVQMSTQDPYPEFPSPIGLEVKEQKVTRANVWRKFKHPTEKELDDASFLDMQVDFDPSLFINKNNPEEIQNCKDILQDNFELIRIAFLEGQSQCRPTFPEISMSHFIKGIRDVQTPEMAAQLPKGHIENCFIRATRGDTDQAQGTLCRGEYMEVLLRCVETMHREENLANEPIMTKYLESFLNEYLGPVVKASTHMKERKLIQGSITLNQFFFDNLTGLKRLFKECKENSGFTIESAMKFLKAWMLVPGTSINTIQSNLVFECFVKCQMTNCYDLSKQDKYEKLALVEFLEFISRVALKHFEESEFKDLEIPYKVHKLLEKIWEYRIKNKPKSKDGKKQKAFPKLVDVQEDLEQEQ